MKSTRFCLGSSVRCVALGWIVLGFAGLAQAAEYYKWVDQNGVTHYSDAPPPGDVQAEKINTAGIHDTNSAVSADTGADADKQPNADAVKLAAAKAGFCDDLRQRLGVLNGDHPTVEFDADGTHSHPMPADKVAALRADLESKQHQFCEAKANPAAPGTGG
jgi:Domain of unknown function (DUF4124)